MAFTAQDVKQLREQTGCGMMDCKKALTETNGDAKKALDILREKGLAAAAKKAGRITAEGLVVARIDPAKKIGVVLEVNAETDFVAKNDQFVAFVDAVAETILAHKPADVETLLTLPCSGSDVTVAQALQDKILTIGENLNIRRFECLEGELGGYVHGGGRIAVLVQFDTDVADKPGFEQCAKDVAVQVTASDPRYLNRESVPADEVAKEKEILTAQAINEGKPAAIAEKIVVGRIDKYFKEICLLEQEFFKDTDLTMQQYLDQVAKELGGNIKPGCFLRFEKGEGIEKREENFADEVAGMMK